MWILYNKHMTEASPRPEPFSPGHRRFPLLDPPRPEFPSPPSLLLLLGGQVHFSAAMNAAAAGNTPVAKAHAAAVSAALSAAAVYGEWAPLAPLMRSGVLDACCQLLSSGADIAFRAQACEVLRHVAHRRRGDTVNAAIASGAAGIVAGGKNASTAPAALAAASADDAARKAAADAAAVVVGLEAMCRGLGVAAQRVLAGAPAEVGSEEGEYARRLTETVATVAANHVQVIGDEGLRAAFLEALLGLTKHPRLDVLAAAIPAWPGLLRAMGAELPGTFVRPDKAIGSGVWGAQQRGGFGAGGGAENGASAAASGGGVSLPGGAVAALLECARTWLQRGGGLASGLSTAGAPECKGDEWEDEYETRDELREAWIGLRARLMEVTKLCTALEPAAAAAAMSGSVTAVLGWVQPGGPLDPAKAAAMGPDGRSAVDDAIGSALEGCVSFVEPAMAAMPLSSANPAAAAAVAPALEGMLTRMLAVEFSSPVAVSQMSRLLESMGRTALVRPDAGTALLHRLFAILSGLPTDDVKSPPARAKAAMTAGRTSQAARQRVCAAILGVCAAAPEVRSRPDSRFPPVPPPAHPPPRRGFFSFSVLCVDLKRRRGTDTPSALCYGATTNTHPSWEARPRAAPTPVVRPKVPPRREHPRSAASPKLHPARPDRTGSNRIVPSSRRR